MEEQLLEPEHYLNIENGDLFIIWWIQNRPSGNDWVKISKVCYERILYGHVEEGD